MIDRGTGRRARLWPARPPARPARRTTRWTHGSSATRPSWSPALWVGFDEKRTLGKEETGGRAPVPIWLEFMSRPPPSQPVTDFAIPEGIVFINVDRRTGLRAAPGDNDLLLECFRRGSEPSQMLQRAQGPAPDDFFRGDF